MNLISARLAQLRRERRRLAENEALDEVMDALRKVRQTILDGPEQMDDFDDDLFEVSWKRSSRNLKQRFVSDSMAGWN